MEPQTPQQQEQTPPVGKPKRRINIWMVIALLLLIILIGGVAYLFGKSQTAPQNTVLSPTVVPTTLVSPTALPSSPSAAPTISEGTVTGRLCYPSSLLPPGKIVAKSTATSEVFTQDFPGSQNGGSMNYTFSLKPDTYHMKYDATGPSSTISGYYTDYSTCVGGSYDPSDAHCSGQKTRPLLPVKVEAGGTVKDVNLCDFYYPPDSPPAF